jgi:carbamoyltransferase
MAYNFIKKDKVSKNIKLNHTYFGTEIKESEIKFFAKKHNLKLKKISNIEKVAASYILNNKIIGWVQGRSEFGLRALGNRSILAAPNSIQIKNKINQDIKKRQFFRPFAPSVLKEHYKKIYITKYESPFMLMAIKANNRFHEVIKGTLHFDNSARVQVVTKLTNRRYYKLISEYYKISGIPLVLNTSFNGKDVPIVNSAKDAILEFKKIRLDALFIGNYLKESKKLIR